MRGCLGRLEGGTWLDGEVEGFDAFLSGWWDGFFCKGCMYMV
jgi:hypothetical protein